MESASVLSHPRNKGGGRGEEGSGNSGQMLVCMWNASTLYCGKYIMNVAEQLHNLHVYCLNEN